MHTPNIPDTSECACPECREFLARPGVFVQYEFDACYQQFLLQCMSCKKANPLSKWKEAYLEMVTAFWNATGGVINEPNPIMHTPKEKPSCWKGVATPYKWKLKKREQELEEREYIGEPELICGNAGVADHLILNPMCVGCARLP